MGVCCVSVSIACKGFLIVKIHLTLRQSHCIISMQKMLDISYKNHHHTSYLGNHVVHFENGDFSFTIRLNTPMLFLSVSSKQT